MSTPIALLIMAVFFGGYFLIYLKKGHEMTESISASFYSWKDSASQLWTDRFYFRIMIFGISIPWFFIVPHWSGFVAGAMVILIGQAAHYRQKAPYILTMHMIGSYVGITMAIVSLALYFGPWYWIFTGLFVVGTLLIKWNLIPFCRENKTWWIECYAFSLAWLGGWVGFLLS